MVKLGEKVKDKLTGFEGVVVARAEYLYGCIRVQVQPDKTAADGSWLRSAWIDEPQIESATEEDMAKPSGPRSAPPSRDP